MRLHRIAVVAGTLAAAALGRDISQERLTVRVYNQAGVSGATLSNASLTAMEIFKQAGIETEWLICGTPGSREGCNSPTGNGKVSEGSLMIIVRQRPFQGLRVRESLAFGAAVLVASSQTGDQAYVFYDLVKKAAGVTWPGAVAHLLGHAMAHEAAHLLGVGHASGGLMRAGWTARDLKQASTFLLLFRESEARQLRGTVYGTAGAGRGAAGRAIQPSSR